MLKFIRRIVIGLGILYVLICGLVYFFQEAIIFHPEKLSADYEFNFDLSHEEIDLETEDGTRISTVLFKADTSKGVVIHYHGNAGSIRSWGEGAQRYIDLGYDLFIMDYRGFGKSSGEIHSEEQLFSDAQLAYDLMKERYNEKNIIIEGYSIGSGIAAKIAADNHPKQLILCAPYYSLIDLMTMTYGGIPTFLLKYPLETCERINEISAPITIFHGTVDNVIPYQSSQRLSGLLNENGQFIPLNEAGHNDLQHHPVYLKYLRLLLE